MMKYYRLYISSDGHFVRDKILKVHINPVNEECRRNTLSMIIIGER